MSKENGCFIFKSQGMAHGDIQQILNISKPTLVSYLKAHLESGVEQLKESNSIDQKVCWKTVKHSPEIISKNILPPRLLKPDMKSGN